MLSRNSGTQYYEKDVLVLWVNESAKGHARWQIDAMQFALTHVKHALFIIGSTNMFRVCLCCLFLHSIKYIPSALYCILFLFIPFFPSIYFALFCFNYTVGSKLEKHSPIRTGK